MYSIGPKGVASIVSRRTDVRMVVQSSRLIKLTIFVFPVQRFPASESLAQQHADILDPSGRDTICRWQFALLLGRLATIKYNF